MNLFPVEQDVLVDTSTSSSGITCLDTFDFVGDGKPELILGRRDGTVQVFTMKSEIDFEEIEPQQLFCQVCPISCFELQIIDIYNFNSQ